MIMSKYDPPADPYAGRAEWVECRDCTARAEPIDMSEIKPGVFLCRECQPETENK
jgi:hypothetical protein